MNRPTPRVRRATDADVGAIVELAGSALGWDPDDPNEAFFRWKHLENPAGSSPMWVAVDEGEIVGFRAMLRWRFRRPDGTRLDAVRAVDTATNPTHQRRGVFTALTTSAVEELTAEGTQFVFNTPNDRSRPGYLRMGWRDEGRVTARVGLCRVGAIARLWGARTAAAKWSEPCGLGEAVGAASHRLEDLVRSTPVAAGLATDRTPEHLAWRYGFHPLHYRLVTVGEAAAIIRLRRRGSARELVIAEMFGPDRGALRTLQRRLRREAPADHLLTLASPPFPGPWLPSAPGLGPRFTVRGLAGVGPSRDQFRLAMGDIELF